MPKISEMMPSNYLKKDDFEEDTICTVQKIGKKNIAQENEPEDIKWLCKFREFEKPLILNKTNIQALADACSSEDTDDWIGKEVVVYFDPNVTFGGERKGGIRIRKNRTAAAPKRAVASGAELNDDDINF